ncbi:MAG: hypothetical protein A3E78_12485 [Alphaproteobacteria bacterium RIFCSPHIGHO2_12_FULL_63_12]|nr:MAG: hypothetical protein A3E78_12485 [Alphaproteobacteria bacterium RIFCSPHIGHO2_12_FULL_63_12]
MRTGLGRLLPGGPFHAAVGLIGRVGGDAVPVAIRAFPEAPGMIWPKWTATLVQRLYPAWSAAVDRGVVNEFGDGIVSAEPLKGIVMAYAGR